MKSRMPAVAGALVLLGALGFSLWARYALIESSGATALCEAASVPIPASCAIRESLAAAAAVPLRGYLALVAGGVAVLLRRTDASLLALAGGAIGVVLYAGSTAAIGFLLGWITLARLALAGTRATER